MYNIPYFKATAQKDVIEFMHQHSFIILCGCDAKGNPVATHVPVLIEQRDDKIFLLAHAMKNQEHTKAFTQNPNVLAIFYGAHTYVSASWYQNKQTASTWNYRAVHAKGVLKFLDEASLYQILVKLTEKYENDSHSPSLVQNMDEKYVTGLMKAIVAFEIEVTDIQHVFKLSQNRDAKSYENIIRELNKQNEDAKAIAGEMQKRKDKGFTIVDNGGE